jgi:RNA polymerase sigma factor (sigma-70 family)
MLDVIVAKTARQVMLQMSDLDLLRRFQKERDPIVLESLIWRHGALVRGVCRRFLFDAASADDAFQATFLILVAKAGNLRCPSLAGWLHRVAWRVCLRMKRQSYRQNRREQRSARREAILDRGGEQSELRQILDQEVASLPDVYREAFVLCQQDERTCEEAARELGCAIGTVHSRLSRAKERLRSRLVKRGVVPAVALVSGVVNAEIVNKTAHSAIEFLNGTGLSLPVYTLAKGVLKSMFLSKLKLAALGIVALVAIGSGLASFDRPTLNAGPHEQRNPAEPSREELQRENARLRDQVERLKAARKSEDAKTNATPIVTILDRMPNEKEVAKAITLPKNATPIVTILDRMPNEKEVLKAITLPKADTPVDDVKIVFERIIDKIDEQARVYPLVGLARIHHLRWKCTVHYAELNSVETPTFPFPLTVRKPKVQVVYIDKDSLIVAKPDPAAVGQFDEKKFFIGLFR